MRFDFLASLITINENQHLPAPTQQAAVEAPPVKISGVHDAEEFKEVDTKADYSVYAARYVLGVEVATPNGPLEVTVNAVLRFDFHTDDDSFEYEYGSIRGSHGGLHGVISQIELSDASIPRAEENYEFFKLPQEQMSEVGNKVVAFVNGMKENDVAKLFDVDETEEKIFAATRQR